MKPTAHAPGDRAGMIVAALCFVHCVAGPALLAFAGFSSLVALSERAEILFLLASAAIGTAVLFPAYKRRHGRRSCLAMFGAGMVALLAHRQMSATRMEFATVLTGASLIAGAHILNLRYSRRCECCQSASSLTLQPDPNRGNR